MPEYPVIKFNRGAAPFAKEEGVTAGVVEISFRFGDVVGIEVGCKSSTLPSNGRFASDRTRHGWNIHRLKILIFKSLISIFNRK